jgi:hypothetical protein
MNVHSHYELESRPDHGKYKMTISLRGAQRIIPKFHAAGSGEARRHNPGVKDPAFVRAVQRNSRRTVLISAGS